jgi:hypothetical protein
LLVLLTVWPYLIALAMRQTVEASHWPLCPECDSFRRSRRFGSLATIAGAVVLFAVAIVMRSNSTPLRDAYGNPTTEPGLGANLGGALMVVSVVVMAVAIGVFGWSRVRAVAGGVVTRDGIDVEFPLAHPTFAQQVAEILKNVRAQPFGYDAEPEYPELPPPGYPVP